MSEWKWYVSAGIFVGVTVLKLLLPEQTAQLRRDIVTVIDMDMDYEAVAVQVGSLLSAEPVQQVLDLLPEQVRPVMSPVTPSPTPSPAPTPMPTATPAPALSVLEAVEAFRASQSQYADLPTPDSVTYDALSIPFTYAAPVSGVTSSGFGYRVHPFEQQVRFHYGTDYAANEGTVITAFADGTVTMTGTEPGYGNYVQITHADGWKTLYAHCSSVNVTWGQQVSLGDPIATVGQTGTATGPHLHLELTCDDRYTNPEFFF